MKDQTTFTTIISLALAACASTNPDLPRQHAANLAPSVRSAPPPHAHGPSVQADSPAAAEVWTCTMHPEVAKSGPGKCPVCGMNLVKRPSRKGAH